jgi:hypothetical protein
VLEARRCRRAMRGKARRPTSWKSVGRCHNGGKGRQRWGFEENAAIRRRLVDILNERDWDAHFELIAEDYEWVDVPGGSITREPLELVEDTKSFVCSLPEHPCRDAEGDRTTRPRHDRVAGSRSPYWRADRARTSGASTDAARSCEMEWGSRRSPTARWCHTETTSTACRCTSRSDDDRAGHLAALYRPTCRLGR